MNTDNKYTRVETDLLKIGRVSVKVVNFLGHRTKNPIDAYMVLKWLCFCFEVDFGFYLEPEEEEKLRRLAALAPEDGDS